MTNQINNRIASWMKIAIEVSLILFAVGLAWATLRGSVEESIKDIGNLDTRVTRIEKEVPEVKADVREIKVSQQFMLEIVKEIKENIR